MDIKGLDEIDREILNILYENSRATYVDIGNKVNLSRVAVKSRIEALEKEGIIEGYTIMINSQKLGKMVSVYFDIEVEPRYLYEVAKTIAKEECTTDVHIMTGSSNLHVHAILEYSEDLDKFLKERLTPIRGIKNINTKIIVSRVKVRKGMRL